MKKTYMTPTTLVVKIHTVKMISASETLDIGDTVTNASGAEGRRGGSGWDDDDDYDE